MPIKAGNRQKRELLFVSKSSRLHAMPHLASDLHRWHVAWKGLE
jgi:hypothetical protein